MDVPWAYSSSDTRAGRASIPSTPVIPATALTVTELGPSTPTVLIGESHLLDRLRSYPASLPSSRKTAFPSWLSRVNEVTSGTLGKDIPGILR